MTVSRRLELVRAYVAESVLPPRPPARLGSITLAPHQRDAAARVLAIMAQYRGALLADDVGLGKTYVALAVAREYEQCHIVAPAALLMMWGAALMRSETRHAQVHSLHAFSRAPSPTLTMAPRTLVVIDEAHHLRNANTARYQHLAAALAGADVLLLSATPLHNRPRDLRALLSLFAGNRLDLLTDELRSALIVRRDQATVREAPPALSATHLHSAQLPLVRTHAPWRIPLNHGTLARIMALPAPLPARAGAEAGALIRMGLLRAWCSSDAALTLALRKRRLRGMALRDALQIGRHPTERELRSWATGDAESQLGFAELLAETPVESGPLLEVLDRHLEALSELAAHHRAHADRDILRARLLRAVLQRHRDTPVVAFSQHARTVQAMYRALSDIAGVGMLTGNRAEIASGPIPRWEALGRFAPRAQERPPPPAHQAIRVLITTDILAEGVNLQDAGVVVHLDLPWTSALRDQRVGRCVRLGSVHTHVHVYRLAPDRAVERVLRLEARVRRKAVLGRRAIGASIGQPFGSSATRRSWLHRLLSTWRLPEHASGTVGAVSAIEPRAAVQRAGCWGALVVVLVGGVCTLVAVRPVAGRWRATTRTGAVLRLVQASSSTASDPARTAGAITTEWRAAGRLARRAVRAWLRQQEARLEAGDAPTMLSLVQRQAMARLAEVAAALSVSARVLLMPHWRSAQAAVLSARSPAAEAAIRAWIAEPPTRDAARVREWLERAPSRRDSAAPRIARVDPVARTASAGPLLCLLLLVPD